MFGDLFGSLGMGTNSTLEAYQLQIDQINIAFKKLDLKIANLTILNSTTSTALVKLLIAKNIITDDDFSKEFDKLYESDNELNAAVEKLKSELKEMQDEYNKKLEEFNKKNEEYLNFLKVLDPDLYKETFGDKEEKNEEENKKDGE